jgi:hypothetical protein
VGQFVVDDEGHSLEFVVRGGRRVNEELGLSEGDATQVLHGSGGEVRDRDQVDFVTGVVNREIVGEEVEGVDGDLGGPPGEVALAERIDDP